MITDSEANVVYISDLLEHRYAVLVDRLRGILSEHGISLRIIRGTKDYWCKDFLPVSVAAGQFVQFRYAPDYLIGYETPHHSPLRHRTDSRTSELSTVGDRSGRWQCGALGRPVHRDRQGVSGESRRKARTSCERRSGTSCV